MTKVEGISLEKKQKREGSMGSKPALAVVCTCSAARQRHGDGERERVSGGVRKNANWFLFLLFFLPQQQANWICYPEFV